MALTAARTALLLTLVLLLLTGKTAGQQAGSCKIEEVEAGAWQEAKEVARGAAPALTALVVDLIQPLWSSDCKLMPDKAEVQIADACQNKADPLLFALLVEVALPCKNATGEAAIVAGQVVVELTTAAAGSGEAGGQGSLL